MRAADPIPAETLKSQSAAVNPLSSIWVSANAGSGKTHVLSRRVIRLLLAGTDPSKILCLTYTRAAASNMSNRIFAELSAWTCMTDQELDAAIADLNGKTSSLELRNRARRLFARALETPGGLKIQTIHAFCEAVLHQFPLEANIAGHFELLDSQMETALLQEVRRRLILSVGPDDPDLSKAFSTVLEYGNENGFDQLVAEIIAQRDDLRVFIDGMKSGKQPYQSLFEKFGFQTDDSEVAIAATAWPLNYFTADRVRQILEVAGIAGKKNALNFANGLLKAAAENDAVKRLTLLLSLFLTRKSRGAWQARKSWGIASKGVVEHFPELEEQFERSAAKLCQIADRFALFRMLSASRAALQLADRMLENYEKIKAQRGYLDFGDLINRTRRLLERDDVGPWIQYKLDRGIDHILVDEAQDTSPAQWSIINAIAEEFFAGAGARADKIRTVFAVGDEKQSIYSFQGAEPEAFDVSGQNFQRAARGAGMDFQSVRLNLSFRSTPDILSAVDKVFEAPNVHEGLNRLPEAPVHEARRTSSQGFVEIWKSLGETASDEPEDWTTPVDQASAPAVQLAERIAATIQGWLAGGEYLDGKSRQVRAGDIMVLVRKRDRFVNALSRSLKNRNVPVAGADRLNLAAHIAVQDLIALGHFVLQPEDDLSLAAVLRSPLFGMSEGKLFELAHGRDGDVSLYDRLRDRASGDQVLTAIVRQFEQWRRRAGRVPVFEFYARILGAEGKRAKLIARLGREAGDIVDEFLRFALNWEMTGRSGLEVFLATLENSGPDIKREMDQDRDEVRIMTVHAAKGLEAPIVFLVDSSSAPFSAAHLPRLLKMPSTPSGWKNTGYLWRAEKSIENSVSRALADDFSKKADEEYRRLLYVAMTRAEDRLIVCGYHGKRLPTQSVWHNLVESALLPDCIPVPGLEGAFRYQVARDSTAVRPIRQDNTALHPLVEPPPQFLQNLPPVTASTPQPLTPTEASSTGLSGQITEGISSILDDGFTPNDAVRRGVIVHRLLQVLPELKESERLPAARRYLERVGCGLDSLMRKNTCDRVLEILQDERFAAVFAAGSQAEVSVTGILTIGGKERNVTGIVDRLAVSQNAVTIVDYKTSGTIPDDATQVPMAHVIQLALYQQILHKIYPEKSVHAALLYTEGPILLALSSNVMRNALVRMARA